MIKDTIHQAVAVAEQLRGLARGPITITRMPDGRFRIEADAISCHTCRHDPHSDECAACLAGDDDYALWEAKS